MNSFDLYISHYYCECSRKGNYWHWPKEKSTRLNYNKHEGSLYDMYFEVANLRLGRSR